MDFDIDIGYIVVITVLAVLLIFAMIVAIVSNEPKFCPECGERWADNYEYCPYDNHELLERSFKMHLPKTKDDRLNGLHATSSSILYDIKQKISLERINGHITTDDEYNWVIIDICKRLMEDSELEHSKKIMGM